MAYGHKILRQTSVSIPSDFGELNNLIANLWNTLHISGGVGLAAPQININKSIFVVDSTLLFNEIADAERNELFDGDEGFKAVFINARIINKSQHTWKYFEGCLSIPGINEMVERPRQIEIHYYDENFKPRCMEFSGYTARVIQHEYDHVNGILFIDHLKPLKLRLLKNKLKKIVAGHVDVNYPMLFING